MRRRRALFAAASAAAAFAILAAACDFTLDGYQGDPITPDVITIDSPGVIDAPADGATLDAGGDASPEASCPSGGGPSMVRVTDPTGVTFCIDSTEVSNAQYSAFLATNPVPSSSNQPPPCGFNTTFAPGAGSTIDASTQTNYPITLVNWCDAYAFCEWAGKRLCGKVGGGGSSSAAFGTTKNEMYFACSRGGTQIYPYSNTFDVFACNAKGQGAVEPVGNRMTCVGGYPGIYDLIGNIGEWQNDCDTQDGGLDYCDDNSTSFEYTGSGDLTISQRCDHFDNQQRSQAYNDLGFRCCAD